MFCVFFRWKSIQHLSEKTQFPDFPQVVQTHYLGEVGKYFDCLLSSQHFIFAKNCCNRMVYVKFIASQRWNVFLRHSVVVVFSHCHCFGHCLTMRITVKYLFMLQAMADVIKSHLDENVACSRRLLNCCPMCRNPTCIEMKQFFARSQKIIDQLHQWILWFIVIRHLNGPGTAIAIGPACVQRYWYLKCWFTLNWVKSVGQCHNSNFIMRFFGCDVLVSDIAIFLLKREVKLQLTWLWCMFGLFSLLEQQLYTLLCDALHVYLWYSTWCKLLLSCACMHVILKTNYFFTTNDNVHMHFMYPH